MSSLRKNNKFLIKFPPFFFLFLVSISLLVISFIYFVVIRDRQTNITPYYKTYDVKHYNLATIIQKKQWTQDDFNYPDELFAEKKIDQTLTAQIDNLGIIEIPFNTHNRSINDKIIFRLKETSRKTWYYQAIYDTRQFQHNVPYPFGFPVIKNSRSKSYTFQIESLNGSPDNSVSLSKTNPYFLSKYKFSKSELSKNPYKLLQFIVAKAIEQARLLTMNEIFIILFSFLSPFIIFVFWRKLKKYLNVKRVAVFIFASIKLAILNLNKDNRKLWIKKIEDFLYKNTMLVLVILLLLTILTRFSISYTDKSNIIVTPEVKFLNERGIGSDYRVAVIDAVDLLIHEKNIYTLTQSYGSGFTLLIVPFVYLLNQFNVCSIEDIALCSIVLYHWLIVITLGGYFMFVFLISFKKNKLLSFLLLYLSIFLLSIFGSFGLERGNIDIILSLFIGFLMLWIFQKSTFNTILKSIAIGFICAFLVNTKFFLLPIAVIAIYSSRKILVALLAFVITFCILGYLPDLLFHSPSNPLSSIDIALSATKDMGEFFIKVNYMQFNHSFNTISSLTTNCVQKQACEEGFNPLIISTLSLLLFIFTFMAPFLTTSTIRNKLIIFGKRINMKSIIKVNYKLLILVYGIILFIIKWLNKQRFNKKFILLLFVISVASLNLLPRYSFTYRLYFSLPLILLLWKETEANKKARIYCLISIICLSIKGFWIFTGVNPGGFNIFESRGLSLFVVLHYYFLIKTGIELAITNNLSKVSVESKSR